MATNYTTRRVWGRSGSAVCISVPEVLTLLLRLLLLCSSSSTQKQNKRYVFCWLLGRFLWFLICSLINFYRFRIISPSAKFVGRMFAQETLPFCCWLLWIRVPIGSFIYLIFSSSGIIFHCLSYPHPTPPTKTSDDEKAIFHPSSQPSPSEGDAPWNTPTLS